MNKIYIEKLLLPSGYEQDVFVIDDRTLTEYINEWILLKPEVSDAVGRADDLEICWTDEYDYEGDAGFMRFLVNQERAITPILSCLDDFDFSCVVIVADIEKRQDKVLWKRIGLINHIIRTRIIRNG